MYLSGYNRLGTSQASLYTSFIIFCPIVMPSAVCVRETVVLDKCLECIFCCKGGARGQNFLEKDGFNFKEKETKMETDKPEV